MNEREMLDVIEAEAKVRRILVHHCRKGYHCEGDNGLPDLLLVGSRRLAFWELKNNDYARLSPAQSQWDYMLKNGECHHWVRLVTPSDLSSGRIGDYLDSLNREEI